jgi:hypothetical protein
MTATLHDILLTTDELVARMADQPLFAITIREHTLNDIYAHVTVQIRDTPRPAPRGALLDLAARLGLEKVDLVGESYHVRGEIDGIIVELFG